jgi:hypothetical protein
MLAACMCRPVPDLVGVRREREARSPSHPTESYGAVCHAGGHVLVRTCVMITSPRRPAERVQRHHAVRHRPAAAPRKDHPRPPGATMMRPLAFLFLFPQPPTVLN